MLLVHNLRVSHVGIEQPVLLLEQIMESLVINFALKPMFLVIEKLVALRW